MIQGDCLAMLGTLARLPAHDAWKHEASAAQNVKVPNVIPTHNDLHDLFYSHHQTFANKPSNEHEFTCIVEARHFCHGKLRSFERI